MDLAAAFSAQTQSLVRSAVSVGLLGMLMEQQRQEGGATLSLIASAATTPPVAPTEPGKGAIVDVMA